MYYILNYTRIYFFYLWKY